MIFCVVQVRAYEFGFYIPVQWVGGVKHMDRTAMITSVNCFGNVHLKDGTIFKNPEYEYSANLHFCTLTENSADVVCIFLCFGTCLVTSTHTQCCLKNGGAMHINRAHTELRMCTLSGNAAQMVPAGCA